MLETDEGGVEAVVAVDELVVGASLHDLAVLDDSDGVGVSNGGEAVSYDNGGPAHGGLVKCFLDNSLRFGV